MELLKRYIYDNVFLEGTSEMTQWRGLQDDLGLFELPRRLIPKRSVKCVRN